MKKIVQISGFTLIELLVVISIIALLIGLALPNFVGARERAKDTKKKVELTQFKIALRLYFTDYGQYPLPTADGSSILACGNDGLQPCPNGGAFSAGPSGSETIYMRQLPASFVYTRTAFDQFQVATTLDNASDADSDASQNRCASGASLVAKKYIVCSD